MKILLQDFNTEVGKEDTFRLRIKEFTGFLMYTGAAILGTKKYIQLSNLFYQNKFWQNQFICLHFATDLHIPLSSFQTNFILVSGTMAAVILNFLM
jgi:hypothetical protein